MQERNKNKTYTPLKITAQNRIDKYVQEKENPEKQRKLKLCLQQLGNLNKKRKEFWQLLQKYTHREKSKKNQK